MRHLDGRRGDIYQTVGFHLRGCPSDGRFEAGRSAEPVADAIAEVGELIQSVMIDERGVDQLGGGVAILAGEIGSVLGEERRCERDGRE